MNCYVRSWGREVFKEFGRGGFLKEFRSVGVWEFRHYSCERQATCNGESKKLMDNSW